MAAPHAGPAVHVVQWLLHLDPGVAYAVLFGIALVEGTGLPGVPFEPVFVAVGYLIARGGLGYVPSVAAGAAGNLAGNLAGYLAGALAGRFVRGDWLGRLGLTPPRLRRVEDWFRRHGGRTVFIGRWFGPIRTPAILAAGFTRMNPIEYLAWSALAASTWVAAWLLVTWRFGGAAVALWQRYGWRAAIGLASAALAAYLAWRWFAAPARRRDAERKGGSG